MGSEELAFISDDKLKELAQEVINIARQAADEERRDLYRNVVDPFSATFDAMRQHITLDEWLQQETARQIQKTLQNAVGDFHQKVLGSMPGFEHIPSGGSIDIRNISMKLIAEVKNKHNTMNSGNALQVYDKLQRHLDYNDAYKGFTAYCIVLIPAKPHPTNAKFSPSDRGTRRPAREDIRIIDGKSFYELATGDSDALEKLYRRLPIIIGKIIGSLPDDVTSSSTFSDLFARAYTGI